MDWARAKTILIIAFIITNAFLAYNVWETKYYGYRNERISDQSISEVVSILEGRGIQVNTSIPKDIYANGILTVEYMEINVQELMEAVYEKKGIVPVTQGDSVKHVEDGIILEVKNNKEIFYNNLDLRNKPKVGLSQQDAVKIGEDFLKKYNLYKPSMVIDSVVPIQDGYSLSLVQQYKDKLLEVSIVEMEVTSGGVHSMHLLWLNPMKMEASRKKIIHAIDALIKVAGQKEVMKSVPVEVDTIRLVHYFDWATAREGQAFPAWKVSVNGQAYYVNAFSGQINK